MAQIITARLSRVDSQPWGFRLQGGKDFGTPLVIQKVHTGSIADKAGLQAGDSVVRINQTDLYNLRHKDAQDAIVKAGPSFELVIQRGGSTWKPTVTPISSAAASPIPGNFTPVTKTSLAANKQPVSAIGTAHNTAARPFIPPSPVRSIVNKQYNSPVAMYSDETIAETLTSQAEVLAGGCLGVNFKKNEKVYNPEKSEVLKALQENDSEPEPVGSTFYWRQSHAIGGSAVTSNSPRPLTPNYQVIPDSRIGTSLQQNVLAPPASHRPSLPVHQVQPIQKTVPQPEQKPVEKAPQPVVAPAPPQISIDGVFVRIKDKNLHVECFKCATCGTSLKNQGYYNLNNKLYCDVHARLAAMNSPPPNSNGLMPVAVPPKNLGASTISSALNAHAGNLNGNNNQNESHSSPPPVLSKGTKVNDDNNNRIMYENRSTSETDCSSLSSSDKENDSRPSSSHGNNINVKSEMTNGTAADGFHYRTLNGRVIKSVIPPGKGVKVNYKVPSNISGPKPFSYTQPPAQAPAPAPANPPMAAPKSPSSYPPPSQPAWAPPSATPAAPKPQGGFNKKPGFKPKEFIDIEKCNGKPREEEDEVIKKTKKKKEEEVYLPCDSDEEFDPIELVKIAKPPPSNFTWPPPIEEQKVPIAAPIYVPVPETLHVTAKPCTEVKPLGHRRLTTQNLRTIQQTQSECLNVESNITATTSTTSNASSESEYKMYQTQNNQFVNMFEKSQEQHEQQQQQEHDDEVEEINKKQIEIDLRKTPPQIELPKDIKVIEFVEPDPDYQPETFTNVFSKKKETWQKLTEKVVIEKRETKQVNLTVEATDDNPENSEVEEEQLQQEDNEVEEINEQKEEVTEELQHVGPYDGTYYQLPPSNIPQPVPKGYQSGFGKALVYSSDKPFSIRNLPPTPEPKFPCLDLYQRAIIEAEQYTEPEEPPKKKEIPKFEIKTTTEQREFPHEEQDVRRGSTLLSSMMRTASPRHMEFVKSNIIEEVSLPNEMEAYFPPPISMVPNEPYPSLNSYRTKSPFVSALTTVSDRPFTPFGREIKSQLSMEPPQCNVPKTTFSNALHTAPDESFDPSTLINQPEYEYVENDPIEYTAKVYERITVEATAEDETSGSYTHVESFPSMSQQPYQRSFLPKIQPWSVANEQIPENVHKNSICSCQESVECIVSDSRRCSQLAVEEPLVKKDIHDLLKYDEPEEEFDPDKPSPNAPYPRRMEAPSPFEGMQVKITNKMTSGLHKPDEIPQYQRKWFNLPTQNPPHTPEPEELRENVPVAFQEWHETKQIIASHSESAQRREIRVTFAEKPPIPHDTPTNSRRGSVSEKIQWMEQTKTKTEDEVKFPTKPVNENLFPTKVTRIVEEANENDESEDQFTEMKFPTKAPPKVQEGSFPMKGVRKNSIADLQIRQDEQFQKQKTLKQELEMQQQRMLQKNKIRQQKELEKMQKNYEKMAQETISEEIQQNSKLSAYEAEQEYKRQLQLEKEQRQKEMAIKEQQARELEYQRQMEEKKLQEIRFQEKRERDLQVQAQREAEYRKHREEQEEALRIQQEQEYREMMRQQEEVEKELLRQQEKERREAEKREAQRLFEIRRKEEKDRELARIEAELRTKREEELKRLEQEIREKREQRQREEKEAEQKRQAERKAREDAEREAKRLEEEAIREQKERERQLQAELKLRQKQEADRKQREEMELFNIEEERRRNEELAKKYHITTYQQQHVWPPSTSSTPAPNQQSRTVPIIKTDSETELNASKFHFEPLDEEQKRFMAGIRPPSTCYSPPTDEKPYPSIPYYQQHLAFYETAPDHCGIFDPRSVSPAPVQNRSRSPAFGPPPNPLRAFVNRERDPVVDESGIYLCGERLLSPVWYEKSNKKIPPPVQRRIQNQATTSAVPPKPDLEAIKESIKQKKQNENVTTKPPPTPPPMPKQVYKATLPAVRNDPPEVKTNETVQVTNISINTSKNPKEASIATDLLKESVDRLNINSQNSDFRKNASNVLAAMLEARMKKKQQPPQPQNGNKFDDPEFLPPPPPIPSNKPQTNNNHDQDLPLPPPPSPCKIPSSILTPPLSSDENDLPMKKCYNNNPERVNYRHKKHHHSSNQSSDSSPASSTSSFHGISKPELSTHARDRRSYIEKNNNNNSINGNIFNSNEIAFNNSVDKDTLDSIANGIANGQHPVCDKCKCKITRGPFVTALGRTWCPAHFLCVNQNCRRELMDIGFVEEKGDLYCEYCFEQFLAPPCSKCNGKIKGDCLNAIGRKFHPECFKCTYCAKLFGNNPFFLEEGEPYCEADWNELFTTKCFACGFPVEAGDRWVEALNNNYHSQCFNCTYCKKNLEGQSFFAKGGRPFCKNHAR